MAINANTDTAARLGKLMGMHLSAELPKSPTGEDAKSAQISTGLTAFLAAAHTEITTYNKSVDALREGCTSAPQSVDATDRMGAELVNNSTVGGTTYI